jgi:hypothetical protein
MLKIFAQEFGVTLEVAETQISVFGIDGAVSEAAKELQKYDSDEQPIHLQTNKPSDVAHSAIVGGLARLTLDGDQTGSASMTADSLPVIMENGTTVKTSERLMEGAVTSKMPPSCLPQAPARQQASTTKDVEPSRSFGGCPTCGCSARFCVHCGNATEKMLQPGAGGCPSCGAVKFCVYCGKPTENLRMCNMGGGGEDMQPNSPSHAGQGYTVRVMPASSPMQFMQTNPYAMSMGAPAPEGIMMCVPMGAVTCCH